MIDFQQAFVHFSKLGGVIGWYKKIDLCVIYVVLWCMYTQNNVAQVLILVERRIWASKQRMWPKWLKKDVNSLKAIIWYVASDGNIYV